MPITRDLGGAIQIILPFSKQALDDWKEFQVRIEQEMREEGRLSQCRDWASKLPGQAARLAAIFHYAVYPGGKGPREVQHEQIEQALSVIRVLISHALAVFDLMDIDATTHGALRIWSWITKKGLVQFTVRECFCFHQNHFKRIDVMKPCINLLEGHGYIRGRNEKKGGRGRPTEVYEVRPGILDKSK
jgi:hypothetical protein